MLIKMTKMALAGALVVGAASAALAGDDSGEYSGGFVIPGSMDGVNPVYHTGWFGKARNSGRTNNAFAYARAGSNKHMARHYDSSDRAQVYATSRGTFCPTLEGYPDCH